MTISVFTRYQQSDGRILGWFYCPESGADEQLMAGEARADGKEDMSSRYYDSVTETMIDRPANDSTLTSGDETIDADGADEANITAIPSGSDYEITGPVYSSGSVTGTTLAFTTDTEGDYTITIRSFPELDKTFEVAAT